MATKFGMLTHMGENRFIEGAVISITQTGVAPALFGKFSIVTQLSMFLHSNMPPQLNGERVWHQHPKYAHTI